MTASQGKDAIMTEQAVAPSASQAAGPSGGDVALLATCLLRDAEEVLTGAVRPGWAEHAARKLSEHGLLAGSVPREWTPTWRPDPLLGVQAADNGLPSGALNRLYMEIRPFDTGRGPVQSMLVGYPGPDMRHVWYSVPIHDRDRARPLASRILAASRHLGMLDQPTLDVLLRVAAH